MKVFVVFGSKSDENVSLPIVDALKDGFEAEYQVISAHRDLEKLHAKMTEWKGDAIIAGAGLAAALPGVVAAMTKTPVFGVAVPSQFGGLDSFASIAQMPPGVPVMTAGPQNPLAIVRFLKKYKTAAAKFNHVHFVAPREWLSHAELAAEIEKARTAATEKGGDISLSDAPSKDAFNVRLVASDADVKADDFCLHVPLFAKSETQAPGNYLRVLEWSNKGGLWVGVNNTRNAVHSALRLAGAAQNGQKNAA